MLPDLGKILTADQLGRATVDQAQQEALALKSQAETRVRESQAQLQEELDRVRQAGQTGILAEAETRAGAIAAATERQVQDLAEKGKARQAEAVAALVSRVLGT
jgi:vacuolar-type H+-ATPase subunit H